LLIDEPLSIFEKELPVKELSIKVDALFLKTENTRKPIKKAKFYESNCSFYLDAY
jgi:hypothetical protein